MYKSALLALIVLRQFQKAKRKVAHIPIDKAELIVNQAMGYAWEIGKGKPMKEMLDASPDNPFLNVDWRKGVT